MKLSLHWLRDFIDLQEAETAAIADRVTEGVAEVEEVEVQGAMLENVVVGKVLTVAKHPNADKLSLCDVQTDRGVKRVVCGGSNLREGMRVAFAHVGARVKWHGGAPMTLEKTAIRGEESDGMICAAEELGLGERFPDSRERRIVDLGGGDEAIGTSLREYLGLTDIILHVNNHAITHRADLFSHVGFAREFVALGLATWRKDFKLPKMPLFAKEPVPFKFVNEIAHLVPRYCSCMVEIDGLGTTPDWMRRRLEATGWRCVSLPVDVTNYVTMELGMPLHSFDAADLKGDVHIRLSKKGEKIKTLDDVERALPEGAIVLQDKLGVFDLMGIMGGLRSSTKDSTRRIYLHSACVDAAAIRRAIIATGHRTDAATVYEKGIPRVAAQQGFFRALELLLQLAPGARIASQMESWGDDGETTAIPLSLSHASSMLGTPVTADQAEKILTDLDFKLDSQKSKTKNKPSTEILQVTPPLHRLGDIKGEHDLIEEIGRVIGYNEIESTMPAADIAPPPRDGRMHLLRDALREERFVEILPLSLTNRATLERFGFDAAKAVRIDNPIGEELSLMQMSTLPGLLEHAQRNILHVGPSGQLRTLHSAHVFRRDDATVDESAEMSLLLANIHRKDDLLHDPFLTLKQSLAHALARMGYALSVQPAVILPPYAHGGRCADLMIGEAGGIRIGSLFEVHPRLRESFDLAHRAAGATVDLAQLLSLKPAVTVAVPLPQFPAVTYDVTVTLDPSRTLQDLLSSLRGRSALLESVAVADLYGGSPLPPDKYNVTLRFTYRAPDRTLTEEEAKKEQEAVLAHP